MSTPHQPPQGSGHQEWQQSAGPAAPYGSAPGQAYGSAPGQAAPGQGSAPQYGDPYGQQQFGQQPQPYGQPAQSYEQQAQQYGQPPAASGQPSQPGQYDPSEGQQGGQPAYGSAAPQSGAPQQGAPQGFAPAQAVQQGPSAPARPGSVMGPLSVRDLGLLGAALLALICLFLPFVRTGGFGFYLDSLVWSWSFWGMAMVFMGALTLVASGLLTLLHKTIPAFPARIGSFTIAQVTTVLVSVSFTANFLHIITQGSYLHVGGWLLFVASLIAFFVGVFTSIPFLAGEYTALPDGGPLPPKARSAAAAPRPQGAAQAYGSQPQAYGSQPQAYGSQPQQYGAPAGQQYGSQGQVYGSQPQAYGSQGQTYGEPAATSAAPAPDAFAQTEQGAAQAQALSGASAQDGADQDETARFSPVQDEAADAEQSTADGQAYLGRESASAPAHAHSEPTQAFAAGAFGTPESSPQPVEDTAAEATDQSAVPAPEDAEAPTDESFGSETGAADESSGQTASYGDTSPYDGTALAGETALGGETAASNEAAPAATGPYVTEDTVGAEPQADTWPGTTTDGADEAQSIDEQTEAAQAFGSPAPEDESSEGESSESQPFGAAHSVDAPPAADSHAQAPFIAAQPAYGEQAADQPAASHAAADQSAIDQPAGAHVRGDEQGESENEPTQWFQMGSGASGAAATAGGAEADSATAASDYDATQGEPTQAFNPVASKMFWFAVPEPRPAVDPVTGQEVFTVTPNQWFLALEDHGSFFKVRDDSGQEGYLNNVERIVRG